MYRDKDCRDRHTSITCRAPVMTRINPYLQVFTMPGLTYVLEAPGTAVWDALSASAKASP